MAGDTDTKPSATPEEATQPQSDDPPPSTSQPKDTPYENEVANEEEEDDDETCGFCRFMKAGGCKVAFNAWSACVDKERDAGGDFTEECRDVTLQLRECMLAHKDYYAPLLEEEEEAARLAAAEAEAAKEDGEIGETLVVEFKRDDEEEGAKGDGDDAAEEKNDG